MASDTKKLLDLHKKLIKLRSELNSIKDRSAIMGGNMMDKDQIVKSADKVRHLHIEIAELETQILEATGVTA